jgi:pimeloyl-ACP methyl ester carboxylesterase
MTQATAGLIPAPGGGELWVQDSGGPGQPVVLLHSGWTDSRSWEPFLAVVARRSAALRCIRYDNRGYGRSPAAGTAYSYLGDLTAVLDHLDCGPAVLLGHSGGGGTAIGYALARPEQVTSLVLAAPGAQDYPWPQDDPFGLVALGLRTWAPLGDDPLVRAQVRQAVLAMLGMGTYERPDPPAFARLGDVAVPSVVVTGDREYPMVAQSSRDIAAGIPGCRTVAAPGSDHLLPLRVPELLADLVTTAA